MINKKGLIYITRHGQTQWNTSKRTQGQMNIPLSDTGRDQAEKLASALVRENIGAILSSDLSRAAETAEIIGKRLNVKVEKSELLREVNFGCWEGHTINEINDLYPGQLDNWRIDHNFCPDKGESLQCAVDRIRRFIDQLKDCWTMEYNVLIVSHGLIGKLLVLELAGIPFKYLWSFRLDNTGLCIVDASGGTNKILCLNDTNHLK